MASGLSWGFTMTTTAPIFSVPNSAATNAGPSGRAKIGAVVVRSEEHTSELQSRLHIVCRLLLEKKKTQRPLAATDRFALLYPSLYSPPPNGHTPVDIVATTVPAVQPTTLIPHALRR